MKVRILLIIVGSVLISCSTKTDSKTKNSVTQFKSTTDSVLTNQEKKYPQKNDIEELNKKVVWFKSGLAAHDNLTLLPKSFMEFCPNFIGDSVFQKVNIKFDRIIGIIGDCESTTILNSKNWEYLNWDFIKFFSEGGEKEPIEKWNNQVYSTEDKVFFEFELKEIGIIYQIGFEKLDNKWKLTLYFVNAC